MSSATLAAMNSPTTRGMPTISVEDAASIAAVIVSLFAIAISIWTHIDSRRLAKRIQVWQILDGTGRAGLPSVAKLDSDDGKTSERIQTLKGTAILLEDAGARDLATKLNVVLKHSWPKPDNTPLALADREAFREAARDSSGM